MRILAAILAAVLVTLPLLVHASEVVGEVIAIAAVLCAAGILALSVPVVTAGAALALIGYAIALRLAAGPPEVPTALAFGVAAVLLLEVVDFSRRVRGAMVTPSVFIAQARYWLGLASAGAAVGIVLAAGAMAMAWLAPVSGHPVGPAVGTLGALAATVGALRLLVK